MKVILSRKGFDSEYGRIPSPIMPDGTLLSLPIPSEETSSVLFSNLKYNGKTYLQIINELKPKTKLQTTSKELLSRVRQSEEVMIKLDKEADKIYDLYKAIKNSHGLADKLTDKAWEKYNRLVSAINNLCKRHVANALA